jgi:hypothetical protein
MLEPILLPLFAKIRREVSRLVFIGLLFTYGLSAWAVCGAGGCKAGLQTTIFVILDQTRQHLWSGMATAYLVEFSGGIAGMTIGLAWDWWKQRPEKAAAKARAEAYAEAGAMYREKLLRAGIDPDTGERLPHFNNGTGATNGQT